MADSTSFRLPAWLPQQRGVRLAVDLAGTMPLVRAGAVHRMESALWLPTHRHRWWELHLVMRGRLDLELDDPSIPGLSVPGGWCCLTPPGRVHRGRDSILPPAHLVWLQLDLDAPLRGSPFIPSERSGLHRRLADLADRCWPAPVAAIQAADRLEAVLGRGGADAELRHAVAGLLLAMLHEAEPAPVPRALHQALEALAGDLRRPITIAAAARGARMSPARLHALCRRHLGTTPGDWLLNRRLNAARTLLLEGTGVAVVARDLGFSSPRYFAHAFRREVGVPPSGYAALVRAARDEPALEW